MKLKVKRSGPGALEPSHAQTADFISSIVKGTSRDLACRSSREEKELVVKEGLRLEDLEN